MDFVCSECGRHIGMMAGKDGKPELFKCVRTGRVTQLQIPVPRTTPARAFWLREDLEDTKKKKKKSAVAVDLSEMYGGI